MARRSCHELMRVRLAAVGSQPGANRGTRLVRRRPSRAPQRCEDAVKSGAIVQRGEPMPGGQEVGRCLLQGLELIVEDLQGEPGIQFRVVDAPALELSVLIVLHQVVIRVAGESQGVESERIYRWPPQEP